MFDFRIIIHPGFVHYDIIKFVQLSDLIVFYPNYDEPLEKDLSVFLANGPGNLLNGSSLPLSHLEKPSDFSLLTSHMLIA